MIFLRKLFLIFVVAITLFTRGFCEINITYTNDPSEQKEAIAQIKAATENINLIFDSELLLPAYSDLPASDKVISY